MTALGSISSYDLQTCCLSQEHSEFFSARIRDYVLIFKNSLPLDISENKISIHMKKCKVNTGYKIIKVLFGGGEF